MDTHLFLSSLLRENSVPAKIVDVWWRDKRFKFITGSEQIAELRRVTRYTQIAGRLKYHRAGTLINSLKEKTIFLNTLPALYLSDDPDDNFLLAMAQAGQADYLVSGDKSSVSVHHPLGHMQIVTPRQFCKSVLNI